MEQLKALKAELTWLKENLILFGRVKRKTILEYLSSRITQLSEQADKEKEAKKLLGIVDKVSRKKHSTSGK